MKKGKYRKIQKLEPEIVSMQEAGKTYREMAEYFGLERSQVKKCLERRRIRQRKQAAGIQQKPKGRPRKDGQPPHQSEAAELKSLSANRQLWYNRHQRRWKKWRKRATSHGQYQMRSRRP